MKTKEALVKKTAFPKPPATNNAQAIVVSEIAHKKVSKKVIKQALMTQSISKALRLDKFNFSILCLIWEWDNQQIIAMIQNAIWLGY